ncbi:L-threonine O-3-phosphate decarboxylase [Lachnospiraceae bacterium]|nr:L-threonine O-3-phosphate decarboxylase [Lachnospiraceae bacterium]
MIKTHGGDIYSYEGNILDFSVNISPFGVDKRILSAAGASLDNLERYPDVECRRLREAIGAKEGVPRENIICGNGAAELIFNAVLACKPKKVLLTAPAFAEYERAVNVTGAEKKYHILSEDTGFQIGEDILQDIDEDVDLVFICNPNNPTGRVISRELMMKIADRCMEKGARLIIDECFIDFAESVSDLTMVPFLQKYAHTAMVVKAFTKMYAVPGLRIGYAMTYDTELIDAMQDVRQPWSVSVVAEGAGIAACGCSDIEEETRRYVAEERRYLMDELRSFPDEKIKVFDTDANYILFKASLINGESLDKALLKANILIRNCSDYRGLGEGFFRIAVRKHEENEMLIRELKRLCGQAEE